jgi:DNA-binding response OmpR family regulator
MRRRIVVVEPDPDIALVLRAMITAAGHAVLWAGDVATARLVVRGFLSPHLVLLEPAGLPDGDGLGLVREIKASPGVPVLVLTAWVTEELREEARVAGADAFLTKPFDEEELMTTVEQLLPGSAGDRGPSR